MERFLVFMGVVRLHVVVAFPQVGITTFACSGLGCESWSMNFLAGL